jgi:hypothetical protein
MMTVLPHISNRSRKPLAKTVEIGLSAVLSILTTVRGVIGT